MLAQDRVVQVVHGDLKYLRKEWTQEIDDNAIRVTVPILRRLLVDNELQRAWKAAGFQREPTIAAAVVTPILDAVHRDRVLIASAGGALIRGAAVQRFVATRRPLDEQEVRACNRELDVTKPLGLRAFVEASCMILDGLEVSRRVLVKYVANKIGGVHVDGKRLDDLEGRLYRRLDALIEQRLLPLSPAILGHEPIYYEVLSCGQALIRSEDIIALEERLAAMPRKDGQLHA